jgi:hypothetical protein
LSRNHGVLHHRRQEVEAGFEAATGVGDRECRIGRYRVGEPQKFEQLASTASASGSPGEGRRRMVISGVLVW